ncbi:MAG TPA: TA system VapC family ribonuclease toxin [Phycisphaerae bacterium]|nr:TA system VapC family ribonuclease toxin [Phycisphaerae bacterium]
MNVLIALTEPGHEHYRKAQEWFHHRPAGVWGICPLTEAGFIRITAAQSSAPGALAIQRAIAILQAFRAYSDFWYFPITESWIALTAPLAANLHGHQQVTDAYLLGLAIQENAQLVTFDQRMRHLAGEKFADNLLVLES